MNPERLMPRKHVAQEKPVVQQTEAQRDRNLMAKMKEGFGAENKKRQEEYQQLLGKLKNGKPLLDAEGNPLTDKSESTEESKAA